MKAFSSEQIQALNAQSTTGRFMEAVTVTRDMDNPLVKDYFVRNKRSINFNGHTFLPLDMTWEGVKLSTSMELPTNAIGVSNLGGAVCDYLEDPSVILESNDVLMQVLFMNRWGRVTLVDEMLWQVEVVVADYHETATIHLGVSYSLGDIIPRQTIETQEYPGIREDIIRVGTV